jgi:exopolysaccharide production protein ExoF
LGFISGYLADLGKLARSGLVERRRVIEMQQEQARLESSVAQLGTQLVRASQLVREAPLRIADVRASARQRALLALQEANTRLAELETGIEASRDLVSVRRERVSSTDLGRTMDRPRFMVTRNGRDGARTIEAQETTALHPGDVLRVRGGFGTQISGTALDRPSTTDSRRQ